MAEESFQDLKRRVRQGDEAAVAEVLRHYEPALRRVIHVRLLHTRSRRLCDVEDVCQSVFGSFFVRAALGQYQLQTSEDLLRLLATMARNKLIDLARRPEFERQADRRVPLAELPEEAQASPGGSPSQHVAMQELVHEARRRLSPDERALIELREQGLEWAEIADRVGGTPEALRKRLARATGLVLRQLGLDEDSDA